MELCGEYPGAVTIRNSYTNLEKLKALDQETTGIRRPMGATDNAQEHEKKSIVPKFWNLFRKKKGQPKPSNPSSSSKDAWAAQQPRRGESTDTANTGKPNLKQAEASPEAANATNDKKVMLLELAIGAIDLLSDVAGLTLPNTASVVLRQVMAVMVRLQVCTIQTTRVCTDRVNA
jgi:hypothetical protein